MKSEKVINILQKIYSSLKNDDGIWREEPVGIIANANTSDENVETLKLIINTILGSDKISDEVKLFISNEYTIREVNEEINRRIELRSIANKKKISPYSYGNTCKKITDTNDDIVSILGIGTIRNLIYNRTENDDIKSKVDKFIIEYGNGSKLRNNLLIDIDTDVIGVSAYKNNEDFFDILGTLENYLISRKAIIQKAINNDKHFVSYFNYLLNSASLNDKEALRDRERLLKFLNNEDYKTGYVDEDVDDNADIDVDSIVDDLMAESGAVTGLGDNDTTDWEAYNNKNDNENMSNGETSEKNITAYEKDDKTSETESTVNDKNSSENSVTTGTSEQTDTAVSNNGTLGNNEDTDDEDYDLDKLLNG